MKNYLVYRLACILYIPLLVQARAPLVSLTVSILNNSSSTDSASNYQATFDKSDYAYPLPQTGLNTFGFSGELYVPESAVCADPVIGKGLRHSGGIGHPNGIVYLPYKSCHSEWEQVLIDEVKAGRAAGALLFSMKDDAAQAAERIAVNLKYLHAPVWMVNVIAGEYLTRVLKQVHEKNPKINLPPPPTGAEFQRQQDDVRLAIRAVLEGEQISGPHIFVTISRSAADVATADRNFFLKAMIGVGITGIVCFFIAMSVRYLDCLRLRRRRQGNESFQPAPGSENEFIGNNDDQTHYRINGIRESHREYSHNRWPQRSFRPRYSVRTRRPHAEKRVLKQVELDTMECRVITKKDIELGFSANKSNAAADNEVSSGPAMDSVIFPATVRPKNSSCPQLSCFTKLACNHPDASSMYRTYSMLQVGVYYETPQTKLTNASSQDHPSPPQQVTSWDSDSVLECAICLEEIRIGDVVRELPCPHLFHSKCIDRWLLNQSTVCPLCKRNTLIEQNVKIEN